MLSHADFLRGVQLLVQSFCDSSPTDAPAILRLKMMKQVVPGVLGPLGGPVGQPAKPESFADKLGGVVMQCLRAMEQGNLGAQSQRLHHYAAVGRMADNPYDLQGNLSRRLRPLKERAAELAKDVAT